MVSGKNKTDIPPAIEKLANIRFGIKRGKRMINGAAIPPRRPIKETNPRPVVRMSVVNISAAKTYIAHEDADIENFPAKAHQVAAVALVS